MRRGKRKLGYRPSKAELDEGKYWSPEDARKRLQTPLLDFFVMALMMFGPPKRSVMDWQGIAKRGPVRIGPYGWVSDTMEGKAWADFVESHGDARGRAPHIYRAWYGWHRKRIKYANTKSNQTSMGHPDRVG